MRWRIIKLVLSISASLWQPAYGEKLPFKLISVLQDRGHQSSPPRPRIQPGFPSYQLDTCFHLNPQFSCFRWKCLGKNEVLSVKHKIRSTSLKFHWRLSMNRPPYLFQKHHLVDLLNLYTLSHLAAWPSGVQKKAIILKACSSTIYNRCRRDD